MDQHPVDRRIMRGKSKQNNLQVCQQQVQRYGNMFPHVQKMVSKDLLKLMEEGRIIRSVKQLLSANGPCFLLVDVRTKDERDISVIPGAISMKDFKTQMKSIDKKKTQHHNLNVITYCTIGFRSGLQAQHIQNKYKLGYGRVHSLDGIAAYTHAITEVLPKPMTLNHSRPQTIKESMNLIVISNNSLVTPSGHETTHVHTFGNIWSNTVDQDHGYHATFFKPIRFILESAKVGVLTLRLSASTMLCRCIS